MRNYTDAEIERWTRQMATLLGWTDIRKWDDPEIGFEGVPPASNRPDQLPEFREDLNALAEVARKLDTTMLDLYIDTLSGAEDTCLCAQQARLTADELFQIYGRVTDQMREKE